MLRVPPVGVLLPKGVETEQSPEIHAAGLLSRKGIAMFLGTALTKNR